jgi:hypothetical protein
LTDEIRRLHHVSISFLTPNEATIPIAADSVEHARALATEMFANRVNFQIHDCYHIDDCPELKEMVEETLAGEEDDTPPEPTKH